MTETSLHNVTEIMRQHPAWCPEDHLDSIHCGPTVATNLEAYPFHPRFEKGQTSNSSADVTLEQIAGHGPQIIIVHPDRVTEIRMTIDEAAEFGDALLDMVDLARGE